jgi:hypothetical protein
MTDEDKPARRSVFVLLPRSAAVILAVEILMGYMGKAW